MPKGTHSRNGGWLACLVVGLASLTLLSTSAFALKNAPLDQSDGATGTGLFPQTGFGVDGQFTDFFQSRGAVDTFGYPVSRAFTLLGCPVQIYQRQILQNCPGQGVGLINLLDPEIFPYTIVNGSVLPGPDELLKAETPRVGDPDYDASILEFVRTHAMDTFQDQPVNFGQTFFARGGLAIWGAPISQPAADPGNAGFVYQRFQRGVMHYRAGTGTESILLADYFKAIIANNDYLPADLSLQAQGSAFFAQYCPGRLRWLCRPDDMPSSDLTLAFEPGDFGTGTPTVTSTATLPSTTPTPAAPTPGASPTETFIPTATATETFTPTTAATETPISKRTAAATATATFTPTAAATQAAATATATFTPTAAATATSTRAPTASPTGTATPTGTPPRTRTPTGTPGVH